MISRETDFTKQEDSTSDTAQNFNAGASSTTSWSRLRDPRIIRVSRAFGGKDRHSKVCTVKGPRDRRVRLSVHTAIQLYDLQDRLGLNQPSKVVDWLLNAAKHEIDELPPLQFPQGSYCASLLPLLNNSNQLRPPDQSDQKQGLTGKLKDVSAETRERDEDLARSREEERQFNLEINQENAYVSTENFSSSRQQHPSSLSSLMNTSSFPFNSFVRWDPSNLSLSQSQTQPHLTRSPGSLLHPPQSHEDWHNFSLVPMQSALSTPSVGSHHHPVLVYQPFGMSAQPYFHSQISAASYAEFDAKHLNFQSSQLSTSTSSSPTVESSTLPARPFHFNMTANLLPSQNNDES